MPLQLPNLDDRRYADLVEEARALIPTYAPEWTNHNPSDPGITLIELFAFLSEMLLYRLNRVTAANILSFLKLLNGTDWNPFEEEGKLTKEDIAKRLKQLSTTELAQLIAQQLPKTVLKLRRLERAVSCSDFESLALEADTQLKRVQRVRCLPRCNMDADPERERAGHVSVIILPRSENESALLDLITIVKNYLTPKLLLTTQLHVVGPQFVTVGIKAAVVPLPDERESALQQRVVDEVQKFFDPRTGGEDGQGWPFGRNVFVSEIYSLLDQLPGVDYVIMPITLTPATPGRLISSTAGELIGVDVKPYELVKVQITPADVTVQTLTVQTP
jgi:Baseplate J-like protein